MAVDVAGNIAYLQGVLALVERAAPAVADKAAQYIAERIALDTLTRQRLSPGMYHRARPGAPPAMMSGKLADAMFTEPASGGLRASALVGNSDKRARVFELGGCILKPTSGSHLGWKDTGRKDNPSGIWRHRQVDMDDEHPFIEPTTDEAIDEGELQRIMIEEFRKYDP